MGRRVEVVVEGAWEACCPCSEKLQVVLAPVCEEFVSLYVSVGLSILSTPNCLNTFTTSNRVPEKRTLCKEKKKTFFELSKKSNNSMTFCQGNKHWKCK